MIKKKGGFTHEKDNSPGFFAGGIDCCGLHRRHISIDPTGSTGEQDQRANPGASGLRSSVCDMLSFLAANAGLESSPLFDAMQETHKGRFPISKDIVKAKSIGSLSAHEKVMKSVKR